MAQRLAIAGGAPVRRRSWPAWPQHGEKTVAAVQAVLASGRWAITGPYAGQPCFEQEFARRFAAFHDVPYCVPTDHGSTALLVALEALDIGPGDEVIVPGLTWVATASAVLNVGAVPVLVDVDPNTLCISCSAAREHLTPRTRAIIPVHLYGSMCDMDALCELARRADLAIIEDCAHVHGARWNGRRAGTLGDIGAFSMQQGKLLTAGEGGAAITRNEGWFRRMAQARCDGRIFSESPVARDEPDLLMVGELQGTNFCLSELQAAILNERLGHLERQNAQRRKCAEYLDSHLSKLPGLRPQSRPAAVTQQSYYHYLVRYDPGYFAGRSVDVLCAALSAELGFPVGRTYIPLDRHPLYVPQTKRRFRINEEHWQRLDRTRASLPVAAHAFATSILFHHRALLGTIADMKDVVSAFEKVLRRSAELPASVSAPAQSEDPGHGLRLP